MRKGKATLRGPPSVTLPKAKTRIETHSQGEAMTVAIPWRMSARAEACGSTGAGGMTRRRGNRKAAETRNETLSMPKATDVPPHATSSAPTDGPTMPDSCQVRLVRALALGSASAGTIWGAEAGEAGWEEGSGRAA